MNETPVAIAFLDANVLYPALLRNILMRLAMYDLFSPRWSQQVHDEWTGALLRNRPDLSAARIAGTRDLMDAHIPAALVSGFDHLIEALTLPDRDDRHVLAAAIHSGAAIIVTANTDDFPAAVLARFGIEAMHPDPFILGLIRDHPAHVIATLHELLKAYINPPVTAAGLLATMKRQGLITSAEALSELIKAH